MALDANIDALYRAPINLWVEDALTREYLSALWHDPDVGFLVAGGSEGVRGAVKDAEQAGQAHVFGLVDRDFRRTNRDDWANPRKTFRVFVLPRHEIENYLLDAGALTDSRYNNTGRTQEQIEVAMREKANTLHWWHACRSIVGILRQRFHDDFIDDPPRDLSSQQAASSHICDSPWFRNLKPNLRRTTTTEIRKLLMEAHADFQEHLAKDTWKLEFAGKEVFHDVESRLHDRPSSGLSQQSSTIYADLAKDVAVWQADQGRVPDDLSALLRALKQRSGIP